MVELLAPAKDKICAKAAIDCGADAVYIGASEFGARKNAPNSLEDIKEIVDYAHKFGAKIYITLNTILNDDEVLKARDLVFKLDKIGVDAVIIQDMGLMELLQRSDESLLISNPSSSIAKPLKLALHASTQCDNRTVEKVKFLQEVGFSRVVLARELSLEQIKEIKDKTNVELEVFIHGALCVSYSGQCYLSQMIGGRSSNRGECAQPCRKKYSLVDDEGNVFARDKHLLNLKDFNASEHIKKLAEIGVTSFKIEGRLKDEAYVRNVVGYYRKLIDQLKLGKTSSGKVLFDFEPSLEKAFNRGFSDYFLTKRHHCYSFDTPKSKGELLGKIKYVGHNFFEISRLKQELNPQDGICFFQNDELKGTLVNKFFEGKIYPNKMDGLKVGVEVYRNLDFEFDKKIKSTKTTRKLCAKISFELGKISAVDEDDNIAQVIYKFDEFAQNEEKMRENIANQLKKSGDSDFLIDEVLINTGKIPFLPVSKLNELRRELLEKLMYERISRVKEKTILNGLDAKSSVLQSTDYVYPESEGGFQLNVYNSFAKEFYENHGVKITEMALESGFNPVGRKAMTTKHCLKFAFNLCKTAKNLYLVDEKGKKYPLKFDCKKCQMEVYF